MKSESAKQAVADMIYYYEYALVMEECNEPKLEILKSVAEIINATEEELEQVKLLVMQGNKFIENLDSSIQLLSAIEESKTLDLDSIKIVRSILELTKEMSKRSLKHVVLESEKENEAT